MSGGWHLVTAASGRNGPMAKGHLEWLITGSIYFLTRSKYCRFMAATAEGRSKMSELEVHRLHTVAITVYSIGAWCRSELG